MTETERFKVLTGIPNGQEELISVLLGDAADAVCDFIGRDNVPERLVSVQVQLAVIAYNRRGAEGESSRSEGGISQSFDALPPDMLRRLRSYPRKAGVIHSADSE